MRKKILALSIASMVGGLGFVGAANAVVANGVAVATTATVLETSRDGIGHILLVPYFTAQGDNATLINLVNTDTVNGKAVKVRFRGAANSDDIFDFQIYMSPGDVWTGNVSRNATSGLATLTTPDNSCTLPMSVRNNGAGGAGTPFVTSRLNSALSGDALANGTREGYVEIFNMADIPVDAAATSLYTSIKHNSSGVAPCTGTIFLETLKLDPADAAAAEALGFRAPSTGLFANWTIINLTEAAAYSGAADAIVGRLVAGGAPGTGKIVFSPQMPTTVTPAFLEVRTADPLLAGGQLAGAFYDLPDLSTPYTVGGAVTIAGAAAQADAVSDALAVNSVVNEYFTNPAVGGGTDWVVSSPSRRYAVALNYAADPQVAVYNALNAAHYAAGNTSVVQGRICVSGITPSYYDQSERPNLGEDYVVSPGTPTVLRFCGETSVLSINGTGTMSSVLQSAIAPATGATASTGLNFGLAYSDGWMRLATPGATGVGLPIIGAAFSKARSGAAAAGTAANFGANVGHRYTRP
ncbi:MAG: hypothetical protein RIS44_3173 [Pseudomonadota bacterium]|jgi:hypothetical protein